jgi:hypothetical protein
MISSTNIFQNLVFLFIQLEQAAYRVALVLLSISVNFVLALIPMP